MISSSNLIEKLLADLHADGRLRVWSLVITIFGDAIAPRGGVIGLSSLQRITEHIGIAPNALRTALSRLASDGWVSRMRTGRQSFYQLAPEGTKPFEVATRRIYGSGHFEWDGVFEVVLRPDDDRRSRVKYRDQMRRIGFGTPVSNVYVRPAIDGRTELERAKNTIFLQTMKPDSADRLALVERAWPIEELSQQYQQLVDRLAPLVADAEQAWLDDPLDALALRIILIHEWRKLVLRDVDMPDSFRSKHDLAVKARADISSLYGKLIEPSERFLDTCNAGEDKHLPLADERLFERFNN